MTRSLSNILSLVHTIFMLCIQLLRVTYYVTMIGSKSESQSVLGMFGVWASKVLGFRFLIADAYSLLGSAFLFLLRYV